MFQVRVPLHHPRGLRAALRNQLVPHQGGGEPGLPVAGPLRVGGGGHVLRRQLRRSVTIIFMIGLTLNLAIHYL